MNANHISRRLQLLLGEDPQPLPEETEQSPRKEMWEASHRFVAVVSTLQGEMRRVTRALSQVGDVVIYTYEKVAESLGDALEGAADAAEDVWYASFRTVEFLRRYVVALFEVIWKPIAMVQRE